MLRLVDSFFFFFSNLINEFTVAIKNTYPSFGTILLASAYVPLNPHKSLQRSVKSCQLEKKKGCG